MTITWKIVGHSDKEVVVELDGCPASALNFNLQWALDPRINPTDQPPPFGGVLPETSANGPKARPAIFYTFTRGQIIPTHSHGSMGFHDIRVMSGEVLVRKTSGDVIGKTGDVITVGVDELHSVEAVSDNATTLHVMLPQAIQ